MFRIYVEITFIKAALNCLIIDQMSKICLNTKRKFFIVRNNNN